jgi:hypothetical protein
VLAPLFSVTGNKAQASLIYSSECEVEVAPCARCRGNVGKWAAPPGPMSTRGRPAGRPLSTSGSILRKAWL